jgi:TRAP-type C4-dicarboxylate transport system substrate-binding protein
MTARMAELLGASPVQIQVGEIAQAFSTNLVQVMYTSAQTGVDSQAWDFAKYYTNAKGGNKSVVLTVVNTQAFDKLELAFQKALLEASADAQTYGWILNDTLNEKNKQILKDRGMTIQDPVPALDAKLDEVGLTILKEWAKDAGPDGETIVKEFSKK